MITEEDEYFLRASILLLKGGRLMSKETLYKKLRKAGGNLDVLLKQHERKFKHKFVKKQMEKLFPVAGVTDVETWDLAMLTTVSLAVFKQSLNDDEKNDLKSIKCMRDEIYAHTYSSSLSADQYEEIRKELQKALTSLSNGLSEKLKNDCFKIIQECTTGPISPSLKAELTQQIEDTEHSLQAVMNKLRNQNEFLCEMRKDIMDTLKKISVTEDRSEKIIKVIDLELTLSGAVNDSKDINFVEGIITTVINKAIKKVGNANDDYPRIRSVVEKILKDIENMPDVEILPAEHKCILLRFRCTTYIGILNMMMYLESSSFLDSLNDLALALSSTLPNVSGQFRLDATVTQECMKNLLDELRAKIMETTKYERMIRVPIKVESVQGIKHIWSLFETGGATNRLNELSEAVFDELNTKITVTPSVNLEQVQAAIKEAGETSAEVSQAAVEDNANSPQRHQSKSVDEDASKKMSDSSDSSDVSETEDTDADSDGLKPRKYQLELAENALMGNNTIICSGTGAGKTIVALHIIKKHLEGAPKGERKVVFMARTGALIKQQAEKCKQCLQQYETRLITGDEDRTKSINMFMQHYDILCFTPQILVNSLDDNLIESLSVFSLLVLDKCHYTRENEPYAMLMRKYLIEKYNGKKKLPQIVGLTASVGVGTSRSITEAEECILRLCACLDVCHISTVKKNEKGYKKHIKECTEETIRLEKRTTDPARGILLSAMKETEDMLEENGLMQPDINDLISEKHPNDKESQQYNKWTVEIMKAAQLKVDDYSISRDISSCAKYLNIYNSALEVNKLLRIKDIIRYLAEKHRQEGEHESKLTDIETQLYNNLIGVQKTLKAEIKCTENPNVRILSRTLCSMFAEKEAESRAMVFVKTRATCRSLAAYLDEDLQKNGIKVSPLYGKEDRAGEEGMTEYVQTDILKRFREGIYKVLVCTAVGNEGIDVPDCNIVLSYEYSGDEITKIQMKGRARQMEATAVTMGSDSEKIFEQERINANKALMMSRAVDEVCKLDPNLIAKKIVSFQKEEIQNYWSKKEASKYINSKNSSEDAYEILCGRCNTFVCNISDVRQMDHYHIVTDKTFEERINKKEDQRPKIYDGILKKYKMFCKKCPLDWGIIGIKDGFNLMTLKITNLIFKNLRTGLRSVYKKWNEMPYDVQNIDVTDLPDILKEQNDRIETQSLSLEKSTEHKNRNYSDMVTSVRTGDFSTKHLETDAETEGASVEEFTSTNDDETTIRVKRTEEMDQSNGQNLQTENMKCEKVTRKRKLTAGTSAEPDDGSKSRSKRCIGRPLKKSQDCTLSKSMLDSLSEQMKSVGILIAKARPVGTVFRVGSKYLMTAHHVVKDLVGLVIDDSVYVTFNESVLDLQKKVYRIDKVIFFNQDLDVAVLELVNSDCALPPKMQLSKDDVDILKVKDVSLIGYGHPEESNVKHLDPRCKLISPHSQRFTEAHEWLKQNAKYLKRVLSRMDQYPELVNKGYGCYSDGHKIIFDCYMQQGASGSPALSFNNQRQLEVVGILTHGLPEFYFLLPKIVQTNVNIKYRFEIGSRMRSIYDTILNFDKDLANDLFA